MTRKTLKLGHTNAKFVENNQLIIVKEKNEFNHNLDYRLTQQFSFVPTLIKESKTEIHWELIDAHQLKNPIASDLVTIGKMLAQIHQSNIKFPKNNLRRRVNYYLKIINEQKIKIPEIENNYRFMVKVLSKMRLSFPCHNDVWPDNLIKDKQNKIWLVDWEYATMGDPYYDLAYWIESARLNHEQETIFLNAYFKDMQLFALDETILQKYKMFCNWITLCWAYAQPGGPPFDLTTIKNFLNNYNR